MATVIRTEPLPEIELLQQGLRCDGCRRQPAEVRILKTVGGVLVQTRLACAECAHFVDDGEPVPPLSRRARRMARTVRKDVGPDDEIYRSMMEYIREVRERERALRPSLLRRVLRSLKAIFKMGRGGK